MAVRTLRSQQGISVALRGALTVIESNWVCCSKRFFAMVDKCFRNAALLCWPARDLTDQYEPVYRILIKDSLSARPRYERFILKTLAAQI